MERIEIDSGLLVSEMANLLNQVHLALGAMALLGEGIEVSEGQIDDLGLQVQVHFIILSVGLI